MNRIPVTIFVIGRADHHIHIRNFRFASGHVCHAKLEMTRVYTMPGARDLGKAVERLDLR